MDHEKYNTTIELDGYSDPVQAVVVVTYAEPVEAASAVAPASGGYTEIELRDTDDRLRRDWEHLIDDEAWRELAAEARASMERSLKAEWDDARADGACLRRARPRLSMPC